MKRLLSLIIMVSMLISCGTTIYLIKTKQSKMPYGVPSVEEIEKRTLNNDSLNRYKSVLAFLNRDIESMAYLGTYYESDRFSINDYESIATVRIKSYELTELENGDLDFKFSVASSKCDLFPNGSYHFIVGDVWKPINEFQSDDEFEELVSIIEHLAGYGCVAWEKGKPTYSDESLGFDFAIVRTIQFVSVNNEDPNFEGLTKDHVEKISNKMFGIKKFVPESEYLSLTNDIWEYTTYISFINIAHTVTDIRKKDNKIEIDVQYFADRLCMIPSHKVTVYATQTDDPIYKYYFEKSIIVEKSDLSPLRWSY